MNSAMICFTETNIENSEKFWMPKIAFSLNTQYYPFCFKISLPTNSNLKIYFQKAVKKIFIRNHKSMLYSIKKKVHFKISYKKKKSERKKNTKRKKKPPTVCIYVLLINIQLLNKNTQSLSMIFFLSVMK